MCAMSRHRTRRSPREVARSVRRWAVRAVGWLALGALVGLAAWAALTWAGSNAQVAQWAGIGAGAVTAGAAGVAATMPVPGARTDEHADGAATEGSPGA